MKRFSPIILAILALAGLSFWGVPLARAVEPPPACPMVSLVSGPAEGENCATSGGCTYTLHPGPFANIQGIKCKWEFPGSIQTPIDQTPCTESQIKFSDSNQIGVKLTVADAQSNAICVSKNNQYNSFKPGDHRVEISPKLEVSYPTLNGPGGQKLTITPLTTPAQYIRYAFILALTVLGIVAFLSLIFAGAEWMAGAADKAHKRILGVFTGIVLLLGSYLILSYINPELVQPKDPKLPIINIKIRPVSLEDVKMCNDARELLKNGTFPQEEFTCKNIYTSTGACLNDICRDIRSDARSQNGAQPCSWGSHGCYTVDNCSEVKTCDDYIRKAHIGTKDVDSACRLNICKVTSGCVFIPQNHLSGGVLGFIFDPTKILTIGVEAIRQYIETGLCLDPATAAQKGLNDEQ